MNLVKIMENICDTPFIEFDIYNVFDIKQLREHIRNMEAEAATKILNQYKEIIIYLVIVYEGFEPYITQVKKVKNLPVLLNVLQYFHYNILITFLLKHTDG